MHTSAYRQVPSQVICCACVCVFLLHSRQFVVYRNPSQGTSEELPEPKRHVVRIKFGASDSTHNHCLPVLLCL